VRVGLVTLLMLAAGMASGCGNDDSPIEVSFTERDGVRRGHLTPERAVRMSDDDLLIVSIGDSIAAGEGNPDRESGLPGHVKWTLRRCHRSLLSGHAEAALAAERADADTNVGFVPLGCSGATVAKGLLGRYRGIQPRLLEMSEPPQLDRVNALARKREIDALLLSISANDVYFSRIVTFCLLNDRCWEKPFDPKALPLSVLRPRERDPLEGRPTLDEVVKSRLGEMPAAYAAVDAKLSKRIPRDRVVIVEYFDPTTGGSGPRGRGHCQWGKRIGIDGVVEIDGVVDPKEFAWAQREVLRPLNAAIRKAADEHDWSIVTGVGAEFAGHGICAGADSWVRNLDRSLLAQGLNHHGTLHPNGAGHRATADLIAPVLSDVLEPGGG